ncbi:BatA domain-containing protein [Spongiimicrobium salis]|uniref:BatA domain-containing protein n=1 Tax=Spongiimicrobium salis TaxID=1667022 RepID=UPI00374DA480
MQFKYPELLWALFLLLIPIIIHLFQLRRFKKTAFTNVKLLERVVAESRKSNTLKKWLLLMTRLLLFAALILAFAQPFFAKETALSAKETVIYLDDSFSMQAKTGNGSLFQNAIQDIIKVVPKEETFSLFTNEQVFRNRTIKDIQNDLLKLTPTPKQLRLDEIRLKAKTLFDSRENTIQNLVLISDFQQRLQSEFIDSTTTMVEHWAQMLPDVNENIAIDTAYVEYVGLQNMELTTLLSTNATIESTPVSLYNGDQLIAKTAAVFNENRIAEVMFSLPINEIINGKIEITDTGLPYDNQLFFNINEKEKINVLAVRGGDDEYLGRIFTEDEFQLTTTPLQSLNYSLLDSQNLIVLNELTQIPNALQNALRSFIANGGSVIIVPASDSDLANYNQLLSTFQTTFTQRIDSKRNIASIAFSHPLFKNVFEKKVENFQYPTVSQYFKAQTRAASVLSFEDSAPFLLGSNGVYLFTAPIRAENSNFKNSPLIVPTFYTIGINSLKLSRPYENLGTSTVIDVPISLEKDNILKLVTSGYELIPQQQSFSNKVRLTFDENLENDGIYSIANGEERVKNISFNHPRAESDLRYLPLEDNPNSIQQGTITALFEKMRQDNKINELWKWFIIFAIVFALIEVLIQKVLK